MSRLNLSGLGVALVSPLREDGSIDYEALTRLVEYQIAAGVDFLVALGTTGESATLSCDEHRELTRFVARQINGRVPLIVGVGSNCTAHLVDRIKTLDTSGVDGILSVAPYYNKPTQDGIIAHFTAAARATDLPIVLYNIPGRTGINMLPETTLALARTCPNIIAVKEASGNVSQVKEIVEGSPEDFCVLSGDDHLSIPFIRVGAKGVISVLGNAYPRRFGAIIQAALRGDYELAEKTDAAFDQLCRHLFANGNPGGVKCLLKRMGLIATDRLRLPLVPIPVAAAEALAREYERVGPDL
ncbi:MAG: 4-hydroxy-tetrahydrodipicolinate synthase [Porphyromonas sp.]|nr:4-hydroxy-tetrahydrodipicolinate synthase [Porphyromonas sp.]